MMLQVIRDSALKCWKNGGKSTDNPYNLFNADWCIWAAQWGLCSDDYMDSPNRALDAETDGEEK